MLVTRFLTTLPNPDSEPTESKILKTQHLYIHIPFCHRICPYCAFHKHLPGEVSMDDFVTALLTEATLAADSLDLALQTIYLGGGTPSLLSSSNLSRLFDGLTTKLDFSQATEITLEANPRTFDAQKAKRFTQLGITRVSLGIQAWHPHVLNTLGRDHSPEEATEAYHFLRQADLPTINLDLMFSIPGLTNPQWKSTLEQTIALKPHHISAYNLTYEEDTAFFDKLKAGTFSPSEDRDATQFHDAITLLESAGFEHYETSNYARPGHRSNHNAAYWDGKDYLGLGPGAVSTIGNTRSQNIANTRLYTDALLSNQKPPHSAETLTPEDRRIERIALGLRRTEGITQTLLHPEQQETANHLATQNLLTITKTHIQLTPKGKPLVDEIAAQLI